MIWYMIGRGSKSMEVLTGSMLSALSLLELISLTFITERAPLIPLTRLRAFDTVILERRLVTKRLIVLEVTTFFVAV